VDISSYPNEFFVVGDFVICSVSSVDMHLHSILWVRCIKSLFHKMSVIINIILVIIIHKNIFNFSFNIFYKSKKKK